MSESGQLVKMANQIARNLSFHEDAAARLADHLQRFWAPSMLSLLARLAADGEVRLDPVVFEALEVLAHR